MADVDLSPDTDPHRGGMFFPVFCAVYVNHLEVRHPHSDHSQQVRRILERFQRYRSLYSRRLCDIDTRDFAEYVARRRADLWRGKPLTERTLNNEINTLNAAFAWAGPKIPFGRGRTFQEWITNPPYYEPLPEPDPLPILLEDGQLSAFIEATTTATSPHAEVCEPRSFWIAALFLVGVTSLRRKGLLLIPRPDDYVLLERRELILPARLSKTRREEAIPLGDDTRMAQIFGELPTKPGEPLLPWKDRSGRRMTLAHFNHSMAKIQRRAGIAEDRRITLKHVRSTVATHVCDSFNEATAKKRLGHSPRTNTINTNYLSRRPGPNDRAASDYLSRWLFGAAERSLGPAPENESPRLGIVG